MVVGFILSLVLLSDCFAFYLIYKDELSDNKQKLFQSFLVFFLPIIGVLLVVLVNKANPTSNGKYPENSDLDSGDAIMIHKNKDGFEFDGNDD